jgi:hypothetical protein
MQHFGKGDFTKNLQRSCRIAQKRSLKILAGLYFFVIFAKKRNKNANS